MAALTPDGDALVVTRRPDIEPLENASGDEVPDELLQRLWEQAARLHAAGISHGRLNAANVLVVDGEPMLVDLSAATLGAPQSALDIDTAELLVASTVLVGADRALRAAVAGGGVEMIAEALPYLQRAALTPHVRDLARHQEVAIKELRAAAAAATGRETPPEIAPLRRVRIKDILLTVVLIVAAYLLISQLAEIGFDTIADEIRKADPAWLIVALVLAQATFIPSGISVRGGVPTPLALLPCIVLQSAIKFINLTMPSSAGRIGMNLRFLQRMGASPAEAVAAGAVDDISNTVVQAALFGLTLPFVQADIDTGQFHIKGPDTRLVAAILAAVLGSVIVVLIVPRLRNKVLPSIRALYARALERRADTSQARRALRWDDRHGAPLRARTRSDMPRLRRRPEPGRADLHPTAASILSSLIPVPGGIGAAEASLSAGLIAVGVDESTALAIAITQRLCTFYLPPIWGYVSLRWLTRKGYI